MSSFLLILLVDPTKALWFGIFIIVLQQCDGNIIKPLLFGESMGLPAIWVLVSIILGGNLFGLPGMLLGVPVFSVFYILIKEFLGSRLEKKGLPSEGQIYNRDDLDKYVDGYEYTDEERAKFRELKAAGFVDTFRHLHPEEVKYSWWSYMFKAREKNAGWRIDYFVVSERIADKVQAAEIHNEIFGSDHCPVSIVIEL